MGYRAQKLSHGGIESIDRIYWLKIVIFQTLNLTYGWVRDIDWFCMLKVVLSSALKLSHGGVEGIDWICWLKIHGNLNVDNDLISLSTSHGYTLTVRSLYTIKFPDDSDYMLMLLTVYMSICLLAMIICRFKSLYTWQFTCGQ